MTLGSLFDGAGGFPFAAQQYGIKTLWASEIEPFPVAVTTKRFPDMKHLGDITKINGAEIEPVDIITFGSPCQSVSVAGRREGAKHTDKGDEETTRSGLFYEAIRIIKEMRDATADKFPRYAVLENVTGFFSSSKGEDWRLVLEAFCQIKDSSAVVPRPPKGKWSDAGEIVGDGYSVAWRVLDAQYWGVPQRRRRIFLVADFRSSNPGAGAILFEREGLLRDFAESRESWQGITKSLAFCAGTESGEIHREYGISPYSSNCMKSDNPHSGIYIATTARPLDLNGGNPACNQGGICLVQVHDARGNGDGNTAPTVTGDHENRVTDYTAVVCGINGDKAIPLDASYYKGAGERCGKDRDFVCYAIGNGQADQSKLHNAAGALNCMHDQQAVLCVLNDQGGGVIMAENGEKSPCLRSQMKHHEPIVFALDRAAYNQGKNAQFNIGVDDTGGAFTVIAKGPGAVCYAVDVRNSKIDEVNGTLQAKPNGGISNNQNNVVLIPCEIILRRLTPTECARLQGMPDWWCDDVPHSDSAEYKMWGNGMALPCVMYVMEGIANALREEENK